MPLPQLIIHLVIIVGLFSIYLTLELAGKDAMGVLSTLLGYLGARGVDTVYTSAANGKNGNHDL